MYKLLHGWLLELQHYGLIVCLLFVCRAGGKGVHLMNLGASGLSHTRTPMELRPRSYIHSKEWGRKYRVCRICVMNLSRVTPYFAKKSRTNCSFVGPHWWRTEDRTLSNACCDCSTSTSSHPRFAIMNDDSASMWKTRGQISLIYRSFPCTTGGGPEWMS